jgi:ribonuclease E
VREAAPIFGGQAEEAPRPTLAPTAPAEPAETGSNGGDDTNKPRRTGWWAKRLLGDKG